MGGMIALIVAGLSLGLISSLHCMGMCGPIAFALPLNRKNKWTIAAGITSYSFGRSTGYAFLGFLIGFIGISASLLGILQWISIISGVLIILFAWFRYFENPFKSGKLYRGVIRIMSRFLNASKGNKKWSKLMIIGLLNAFLPCGMVYLALLAALNAGNVLNSAVFMFAFGLGTLPAFVFLASLKRFFQSFALLNRKIVIAGMVSLLGLIIIIRGMNIGIPYISPKIETKTRTAVNNEQKKNSQIVTELSCCSSGKGNCDQTLP
ncbi:MAG: sulfite exporter TauE/SafE family protein [Brumimicrobium sp.]|nr:sulfite exporter TauE/SafE family protein [Brumimicrobium sp.]